MVPKVESEIKTVVAFVVALLFVVSCGKQKEHTAGAVNERDSVAFMRSFGVNTLISDSGMIKYRLVAEQWDINNAKQPPRWEFMKGIFFEQFDEHFHPEAYIQADTAWYYEQQRLWELRGRVTMRNVNGMHFTSEELFWDGLQHEYYSNQFTRLTSPERTIQGTYFRSDEAMNHYVVTNSKGSFVKSDIDKQGSDGDNESADTVASAPRQIYHHPKTK